MSQLHVDRQNVVAIDDYSEHLGTVMEAMAKLTDPIKDNVVE